MDNQPFDYYIKTYRGLIMYHSRICGINNLIEEEDILQEGYLVLWLSLQDYDKEKCSFASYFTMRLKSHFLNLRKHFFRKKKTMGGKVLSLDQEYEEGSSLMDIIPDKRDQFEDIYFNNYVELIFKNVHFSEIEAKVLEKVIDYREQGHYQVYPKIEETLGLKRKAIDNALSRIKNKCPNYFKLKAGIIA